MTASAPPPSAHEPAAATSAPPAYHAPEKLRDDPTRRTPGILTDGIFFLFATLATAWLAVRLFGDTWKYSSLHIVGIIAFWAVIAYLVLPRIHTMLTQIYVPSYFLGRTRTSDGMLGDPVNLALDGTALQIHAAMTRAGWTLADDVTLKSSWAIIVSSVFKRSYPQAPVSPLFLFGRRQCLAYQQEVAGNAAQRHHVRFWRCPDGWLLPGGHRVQWLGSGTYDRAVGLSLFTLQVTHKIDADIDIERDFIVDSLRHANPEIGVDLIKDFSTGYHHRNGGGDLIRTDGDLPIVDLTAVGAGPVDAPLPAGVIRAAEGYPIATDEGGVSSADPDAPVSAADAGLPGRKRPAAITAACLCTALMVVYGLAYAALNYHSAGYGALAVRSGASGETAHQVALASAGILAAVYLLLGLLAVLVFRGRSQPRLWLMSVAAVMVATDALTQKLGVVSASDALVNTMDVACAVVILLTLSSRAASQWSRGRAVSGQ